MVNRVARIFNYRPFTVIGWLISFHTLVYGVGYVLPTSGFENTVLYENLNMLTEPFVFGWLLIILGVYAAASWLKDNEDHIARSMALIAFFWLFAAVTYFMSGAVGLGVGIGLTWSLLSGYIAFAYKNREDTVMVLANQHFTRILDGEVDDDPGTMLH